jgi:hypothetical protein
MIADHLRQSSLSNPEVAARADRRANRAGVGVGETPNCHELEGVAAN